MKKVAKQMQLIREEISKYESEYKRKPKIIITSYSLSVFMNPRLKYLEFEIY